jgi:hypothetical protein
MCEMRDSLDGLTLRWENGKDAGKCLVRINRKGAALITLAILEILDDSLSTRPLLMYFLSPLLLHAAFSYRFLLKCVRWKSAES